MEHQHQGHNNVEHSNLANPPMGMMHHDHHKMMIEDFKRRFYVTLLLTIPVMLLSPMIQNGLISIFLFRVQFMFSSLYPLWFLYMEDFLS